MSQEYITKELAAKRTGRSIRRLLELAAEGAIRKRIVRDATNRNREMALFHAGDIAALRDSVRHQEKASRQDVAPVKATARPLALLPVVDGQKRLMSYSSIGGSRGEPSGNHRKLWLTIDEAADYSGLPASFLASRIGEGRLPALDVGVRKGGRWRIARRDLEAMTAT